MSSHKPPARTARERALEAELARAYGHLSEITSRLLLANEAAEAALSTHERVALSERLLEVAHSATGVRRAALYLVDRGGYAIGASIGLDEDELAATVAGGPDLAGCDAALESRLPVVTDPALVSEDGLAWIEAGAGGEPAPGPPAEEASDGDEGAAGLEGVGDAEAGGEEGAAQAGEEEDVVEAGDGGATAEDGDEATGGAGGYEPGDPDAGTLFGAYVPVFLEDSPAAVLALGEGRMGRPYDRDDLVFLRHLLRQFAVALSRATLIEQNEERLRELDALFRISREITSTLDLDAVLRAVVNTVKALVENDRAEIVLFRGGRLQLRAVAGLTRPHPDQAEMFGLQRPLQYLELNPARLQIAADDVGAEPAPPGADVFGEYFSSQPMRGFMALPLRDDQGLLGFLCLETSQDAWEVEPAEGDALSIVAAQTTVAIRNAMLYSQLPLRGVARPVAAARARLDALSPARRRHLLLGTVAALLVGFAPVVPLRAGGACEVHAMRLLGVHTPTDAVVGRVLVRGGEEVRAGQPLAVMEDLDLAERLAQVRSDAELARRDMAASRQAGDAAGWRAAQIRLAALGRQLAFEEQRSRATVLRAPQAGAVLELDLPQRAGQHLLSGETFCTVAALDSMGVEFMVPEERVGRVEPGQPVAMKVLAFPSRTFHGRVGEVGWSGHPGAHGSAYYVVRAAFPNPGGVLRPGMTGVAKVTLGRGALALMAVDPLVRSLRVSWW